MTFFCTSSNEELEVEYESFIENVMIENPLLKLIVLSSDILCFE